MKCQFVILLKALSHGAFIGQKKEKKEQMHCPVHSPPSSACLANGWGMKGFWHVPGGWSSVKRRLAAISTSF